MDEQSHSFASGIELPIPIMFWEPMEFIMGISLMGFGLIINLWVFGMVSGMAVLLGSRYLKRGAKPGSTQHLMWSLGLIMDQPLKKQFPEPWKRDFTE